MINTRWGMWLGWLWCSEWTCMDVLVIAACVAKAQETALIVRSGQWKESLSICSPRQWQWNGQFFWRRHEHLECIRYGLAMYCCRPFEWQWPNLIRVQLLFACTCTLKYFKAVACNYSHRRSAWFLPALLQCVVFTITRDYKYDCNLYWHIRLSNLTCISVFSNLSCSNPNNWLRVQCKLASCNYCVKLNYIVLIMLVFYIWLNKLILVLGSEQSLWL